MLLSRNPWSAGVGMALAAINATFWLFALPVSPIWSLVVVGIDVLVIRQLAAHSEVVDT